MKALILAAGRGSRMKDLTRDRPKCMVTLRGRPLIEWQMEALRAAGASQIGLVTGYRREVLAELGVVEFHNPRWADTNMVTSLSCARTWLRSEPCIVSYSDIFYEPSAVASLMESDARLALTYDPGWRSQWESRFGDPLLDAETFRLSPGGFIREIGNRPKTVEEIEGQYMGLLRFTPDGWAEVERIRSGMTDPERDKMDMTRTLQYVIAARNVPIMAIPYRGKWGEVDSESDLALYHESARAPDDPASD
ncbi:nucleotidyl transferase [Bordetella bronchialis]|uniref:Nucleotidyl transferase n=2 Tax=Bordetella bronchialis TaxID=463025 RepID=A0A193G4T7_9BORD|nr:nucleotidyl transferase [Bordetella bronchialis]